jgi:iron(III) transport system ATP-binding protein
MTAASIEFRSVSKLYGDVAAVRNLSFTIAAGTLVTLLGPSGCGKTTTLRLIAGLELPSDGAILIGGSDVSRVSAADRDVSMVFQSYALFPHMSVLENVRYGLVVTGVPRRARTNGARRAGNRRPHRIRSAPAVRCREGNSSGGSRARARARTRRAALR